MNKRIVALLAILVLVFPLLAACGNGGGGSQTGNSVPTPPGVTDGGNAQPTTDAGGGTGGTGTGAGTTPTAGTAGAGAESTAASLDETPAAEVTGADAAPAGETPQAGATAKPAASTEGTLVIWADTARVKALQPLVKQFTQDYGVQVRLQELDFGGIRDQLKLAGPAGEGPEIIVGAHDWLGELVANGLVEPLDVGDKEKNFDPVAVKAWTYNGELYGLPYGTEAIALMYNKKLVPQPPKTWDELKQIAKRLQDQKKVKQGYVLQQGDPYHAYPIFSGHGGYIFGRTQDGSYDPKDLGFDSPGAKAAAQEISSMVKQGLLRKGIDAPTMESLFRNGEAAMYFTGPWALGDTRKSKVKDDFAIAPIPKMKEAARPFVGSQGFAVSAFGKNKDVAKAFLTEFVATDEVMQAFYEGDPRIPAWLPVKNKVDDPAIKAFGESAKNGDPMPAIPQMAGVWTDWGNAVTLLFQQKGGNPEKVMDNAAKAIRSKIK